MIEEPPLITICSDRRCPTQQQLDALAQFPTGFLADAMRGQGALDFTIKPLAATRLPARLCAPALTCDCGPADILGLLVGLSELSPGEVLVAATGGWQGSAVAGDRVMGMAKNGGAAGLVTDGLMRDLDGLIDVGLPVFCTGLSPNSPYAKGPTQVGGRIIMGGQVIASGDVLLGDENGIVVVPYDQLDAVIDAALKVAEMEAELDGRVAAGLVVPAEITDLIDSDQTYRI